MIMKFQLAVGYSGAGPESEGLSCMEVMSQDEALRGTLEWQRMANPPEKYDPKEFDCAVEDAVLAALE